MGTPRATPLTGAVRLKEQRHVVGLRLEVKVKPEGCEPFWRLAERDDLPKLRLIRRALGFPPFV